MIGIYKITNPKGKIYIGQSVNVEKRIKNYKYGLAKEQSKLNRSFVKYGYDNHVFEIINSCNVEELNDFERYYQELYNCIGEKGLNLCYVKSSDRNGFHSEETKRKISLNSTRNGLGKQMSEEAKQNLRNINTGKKASIETRLKMSESLKKVKHKPHTDETKQKLREINLGKKLSEEHKLKIKISSNNMSDEQRKKQAQGIRDYYKNNVSPRRGIKYSKERITILKDSLSKQCLLNTETGIFYFSYREAARCYNLVSTTLIRNLNGFTKKNKTNFIQL